MDKIQAMSTFVAVVEAGSFVKAMSVLGISKAAVSRHVAELEQHLETRLLQRTTRRLSLTAEGQRYFERCKEVLAAGAGVWGGGAYEVKGMVSERELSSVRSLRVP